MPQAGPMDAALGTLEGGWGGIGHRAKWGSFRELALMVVALGAVSGIVSSVVPAHGPGSKFVGFLR